MTDRIIALEQAVALYHDQYEIKIREVVHAAERFYEFLTATARPTQLLITVGEIVDQQTGTPSDPQPPEGAIPVQLTDTQKVTLSVQPEDAKGNPVAGDTVTWTEDSNGAVVTLVDNGDGSVTVKASEPGTATITATDSNGLTGSDAFVVVAGSATQLVISEGTPTEQ